MTHDEHLGESVIVHNVGKTYGTGDSAVTALKGVDFTAERSKLTMIVGPSGCGKTTLLSVIAGTLHFDGGDITVLGHELGAMTEEQTTAFRSTHIGFIFQQYHLIPTLTCAENAAIPLLIQGMELKDAVGIATLRLEELGIGEKAARFPRDVSGGQQQRVAIARALVHKPQLIICDEPTSALDATSGSVAMELLKSIATQEHRTVIVVTHDHRIFKYADVVVAMDDGRIQSVTQNGIHSQGELSK